MSVETWANKFWWHWIVANSLAEFLGLGSIAAAGFVVVTQLGEPHGLFAALRFALIFILLGAFEGLVVGLAQAKVLQQRLPMLRGWIRATVVGAVLAWTLGMLPSTLMSITAANSAAPPPAISEGLRLLFAAGLGLITGPVLAFFQWRRLRVYITARAGWWLPANALAWALGMPVIFAGAHISAITTNPVYLAVGVGLSLLLAGALVGAVHGRVLVWMLGDAISP